MSQAPVHILRMGKLGTISTPGVPNMTPRFLKETKKKKNKKKKKKTELELLLPDRHCGKRFIHVTQPKNASSKSF